MMNDSLKTACAADLADIKEALVIADATFDLDLWKRAHAKYRELCDMLHTFGLTLAELGL